MRRVRTVAPGPWDAAYCIGNTLVHLPSRAEIGQFLFDLHSVIVPGGVFLTQIVNFDRVVDGGARSLPELSGGGVTMSREYSEAGDDGRITFRATIRGRDGVESAETPLVALRTEELIELCRVAGFSAVRAAGSFGGSPYRPQESFLSIVTAVKPS